MKEQEIRTCQHHGETIFAARSDGRGGIRWRCLKCETEAVQKRRDKLKIMATKEENANVVAMIITAELQNFII